MFKKKTLLYIVLLWLLCFWIYFIFTFKKNNSDTNNVFSSTWSSVSIWKISTWNFISNIEKSNTWYKKNIRYGESNKKNIKFIEKKTSLTKNEITNMQLTDIQNKSKWILEDIYLLESLYKTYKKQDILNLLVKKLVKNHQFDEAYNYSLISINNNWYVWIKSDIFLDIYLNSSQIDIKEDDSINDFQARIDDMRMQSFLWTDDYRFYKWIIRIWRQKYDKADVLFKQILSEKYLEFYSWFKYILNKWNNSVDMPKYYTDAMVSLYMFKNWYFNVAKHISLKIALQDNNYILPYQILAYSNFLTNNWREATSYFMKLIDLDSDNSLTYSFFIWSSYYWWGKYTKSILYLKQIETKYISDNSSVSTTILLDLYRYLLLDYIKIDDKKNMIDIWWKIYLQKKIEKTDYYTYFFNVFYIPFLNKSDYSIYFMDKSLANSYIKKCYETLEPKKQDVCVYGQAGLDLLLWNYDEAKNKLIYLSKVAPQSYIFQALWDYFSNKMEKENAKIYYLKALSYVNEKSEKDIIEKKILELTN